MDARKLAGGLSTKRVVVLIDDRAIVREGIRALLAAVPGCEISSQFLKRATPYAEIAHLQPDLLVVDMTALEIEGLEVIQAIRALRPATKVLAIISVEHQAFVLAALRAGAHAVVAEGAAREEVFMAVRRALSGRNYLPPAVLEHLIAGEVGHRDDDATSSPADALTTRERQIMSLIARGNSSKAIAERLSISPKTVGTHRANFMKKLGLRNVAEVTSFALRNGYLDR